MKKKLLSIWNSFYYRLWWVQIMELKFDLEAVKRRRDELINGVHIIELETVKKQRGELEKELKSYRERNFIFENKTISHGSFATIAGMLGEKVSELRHLRKENKRLKEQLALLTPKSTLKEVKK